MIEGKIGSGNRQIGDRFKYLKKSISEYSKIKEEIKTGLMDSDRIQKQKNKIMEYLGATDGQWDDYKWQMKNRFTDEESIGAILGLDEEEKIKIKRVGERYRYAVSPYYLSLIDPGNDMCPIKRQAIPSIMELDDKGELDPMDEEGWSPVELVTRRYPDRLIIKVTNICGMYCRFCQRRRMIGECDSHETKEKIAGAIRYVKDNAEIRDVLITGGDAFLLSDSTIEWLLKELRKIRHVEIIRFGSRTPVTLPQRITDELVSILKKYHPVYVNTHFNHPMEISCESKAACEKLADAGIPLGNQMVLLKGINNNKFVVRKLNQSLLAIRVKPYYIFHPKTVRGTSHFWVSFETGMEIIESLRGRTSGLAIPTYIVNGANGLGKTPLLPNYLLYIGRDKAVLRNWDGVIFSSENKR
ncbi:MAG: KamA family radical SAM protein [Clostridia bacterium]|nr:KamA family radical SAM protein [Clostridia bacterium]